jgi:hypothetical protein
MGTIMSPVSPASIFQGPFRANKKGSFFFLPFLFCVPCLVPLSPCLVPVPCPRALSPCLVPFLFFPFSLSLIPFYSSSAVASPALHPRCVCSLSLSLIKRPG